ncbi:MAG: beta-glucosidase [Candidatus Coproplasma sp.]
MKNNSKATKTQLEIKAELVTGKSFWSTAECRSLNLPSVKLSDGPNGMRVQNKRASNLGLNGSQKATCFPTASAVACSFDPDLCKRIGERIAKEASFQGVSMVLGPGLNIKRSPLCGRNFEYFSEDSYLSGKLSAGFVQGVQSTGVSACVKHFAVNSREYARMYCDSRIDEQTLRETYLTGFEIAVKEGKPNGVMTAYNKLNGVMCNQNEGLIRGILRGEWNFDGLVVSDWGGSFDRVPALKAGADLEMPRCAFSSAEIVKAVKEGELDEKYLDEAIEHIRKFAKSSQNIVRDSVDYKDNAEFSAEASGECLVLLKNENSVLPLKAGERVAVIGDFAKNPRYQGAGSSQVNPTSLDNILGAIEGSGLDFIGYAQGFKRKGGKSKRLLNSAIKLSEKADTLILCMGLDEDSECEGIDRKTLSIKENQIQLIEELSKLNKKICVVLFCGSTVLTDWDRYADALLLAHLGGQGGAKAVVNALCGKINPSGRLAESYLFAEGDEPCAEIYSSHALKMDFAEGIYVGYKYYSSFSVPVKYPFGYGLSYTKFEYSDCIFSREGVSFKVKNVGERAGATVAQIYVKAERDLQVSPYELKLFKKVYLEAGEERKVFLPFDEYSFRIWNTKLNAFSAGGVYSVSLNDNCNSKLFEGSVEITPENLPLGCIYALTNGEKIDYECYYQSHLTEDIQPPKPYKGMEATLETPVTELGYCKGLLAKVFGLIVKIGGKSKNKTASSAFSWLRLRSLMQFMGLNEVRKQGFLEACNGHFFKGMKKFILGK